MHTITMSRLSLQLNVYLCVYLCTCSLAEWASVCTCASALCEGVIEIWSVIGVSCVSLCLWTEILICVSLSRTSEISAVSSLSHARDHENETYTHTHTQIMSLYQVLPSQDKENSASLYT